MTPCHQYGSLAACSSNPECEWAGRTGSCHASSSPDSCPGLCPALATSCVSCAAAAECSWCVQLASCVARTQPCPAVAAVPWLHTSPTPAPATITDPALCASADLRPGLTVSRYAAPARASSYPRASFLVNTSDVQLSALDAASAPTPAW